MTNASSELMRLMVAMLIMINGEVATSERLGVSFVVTWSIAGKVGEESEVDGTARI